MSDSTPRPRAKETLSGADLAIPALAVGLAVYFFVTIQDLPWEAQANALAIGIALVFLVVLFVARIGCRSRAARRRSASTSCSTGHRRSASALG